MGRLGGAERGRTLKGLYHSGVVAIRALSSFSMLVFKFRAANERCVAEIV